MKASICTRVYKSDCCGEVLCVAKDGILTPGEHTKTNPTLHSAARLALALPWPFYVKTGPNSLHL